MTEFKATKFDILFKFILYSFLILISVNFSLNLLKSSKLFLDMESYTNGGAIRPYQYRVLMAPIFDWLSILFSRIDLAKILNNMPNYLKIKDSTSYLLINSICYFFSIYIFKNSI